MLGIRHHKSGRLCFSEKSIFICKIIPVAEEGQNNIHILAASQQLQKNRIVLPVCRDDNRIRFAVIRKI